MAVTARSMVLLVYVSFSDGARAGLGLALLGVWMVALSPPSSANSLSMPKTLSAEVSWDQVRAHVDRGEKQKAFDEVRRLLQLDPWHPSARSLLGRLRTELTAEQLREAQRLLSTKSRRKAVLLLASAASLDPYGERGGDAVRLLRRLGCVEYEGRWVNEDAYTSAEKRAARIAQQRGGELGLPERFVLHRRGRIRVYTDLKEARSGVWALALFSLLERAVGAYRQLFLPLAPLGDWEGLDVVMFRDRDGYVEEAGSVSTAGIYRADRKAAFFHAGVANGPGYVRSVLLHEVCHQLDHKLLGLKQSPLWLQEGLAVYFESLTDGPGGDVAVFGGLSHEYWHHILERSPVGSSRWLGISRLLEISDLQELPGNGAVHDFYAQAGVLVQVLLAGGAEPEPDRWWRALFYQAVKVAQSNPDQVKGLIRRTLEARKQDLPDLERHTQRAVQFVATE